MTAATFPVTADERYRDKVQAVRAAVMLALRSAESAQHLAPPEHQTDSLKIIESLLATELAVETALKRDVPVHHQTE